MALSRVCSKFLGSAKSFCNVNCRRCYYYRCEIPACLANHKVVCVNNDLFYAKLGQWCDLFVMCTVIEDVNVLNVSRSESRTSRHRSCRSEAPT